MPEAGKITLIRCNNRMVVDPFDTRVIDILKPHLTFTSKKFLYGYERKLAASNLQLITSECFAFDVHNRMITSWGFWKRVKDLLTNRGYKVIFKTMGKVPDPKVFEPHLDRLADPQWGIELRYRQDEVLAKMCSYPNGCFDLPTGYGKSKLILFLAILLPKAKIHVVTRRVPVLRERIYPELASNLPSVGIVGGGMNITGKRVMLYTAASLHRSDGDADILVGDEAHELASDKAAGKLAVYTRSRNFGLSATHGMRLDDKDLRVEAIFGPVIMKIEYEEAKNKGMVVPIQVVWTRVDMDEDPCEHFDDPTSRKRWGVWRNQFRNELIVQDARKYGDDVQVLITVETVEHAVNLKKLLPEFTLVHAENGLNALDRRRFVRDGFLDAGEPLMTSERRVMITKNFERGTLKKAIATTVWNVGVDFRNLEVLIRADAGGSPINDVQIPGRVSRTAEVDKPHGTVHDYVDIFNSGFQAKSSSRRRTYMAQGWEQSGDEAGVRSVFSDRA